jgi:hypothetical protein
MSAHTPGQDGRPTLVFAVAGYNLAETGRMLEIAKAVKDAFDVPEWVGLPGVGPNKHYMGPLVAKIEGDVPREVAEIPGDSPYLRSHLLFKGHDTE